VSNKKIFVIIISVLVLFLGFRVIQYRSRPSVRQDSVLLQKIKLAASDTATLFFSYNSESYESQMTQLVSRLMPELRKGIIMSYDTARIESFMYDSGFRAEFCVDAVKVRKIDQDLYGVTVEGRQVFIPVSLSYTVNDLLVPGVDVKEDPAAGIFIKSIYFELRVLEDNTKFVIIKYLL